MKIIKNAAKAALKPNEKPTAKATSSIPAAAGVALTAPKPTRPPAQPASIPAAAGVALTAPKPSPPTAPASIPAGTGVGLTTIEVKRDVGFGNAVFLRGQGGGLTWERGLPLVCVDAKTWRWSGMAKDPIKFKLLINDKIWSAGNDLMIAPGQRMEVAPEFA
jgi:hypothetical protein